VSHAPFHRHLSPQAELLCGFDFVVAPLVDSAHQQPALELPPGETAAPRTRRELMLSSAQWGGQVGAGAKLLSSTQ
jgi:hypothetical protein